MEPVIERGFTLIEVMVVLVIVAIMASLVVHSLRPDPTRVLEAEGWRMARLAERVKREANLSGQVLALRWQPTGYSFVRRGDDGRWTDLDTDLVFEPHVFEQGMHLLDKGEAVFIPDEDVPPQRWLLTGDGGTVEITLSSLGEARSARLDASGLVVGTP